MSRYLTDLADVCRRAGLTVIEVDGWPTRARGSGGYADGKPDHCCIHHTASGASSDGWPDVNYCTHGDDDAPLCNLYLSRDGTVYVCAAGGTNTNGKGDCQHLDPDTMNSSAIGIEAGNNGSGEPWPEVQTTAYLLLVDALCDAYGIGSDRVHSHAEWAPDRKVDPYGPSPWGNQTWDMNAFRNDLGTAPPPQPGPGPTPPPVGGDVEMFVAFWQLAGTPSVMALYSNGTKVWQIDPGMLKCSQDLAAIGGFDPKINVTTSRDQFRAFGPIVGPRPPGTDEWGVP